MNQQQQQQFIDLTLSDTDDNEKESNHNKDDNDNDQQLLLFKCEPDAPRKKRPKLCASKTVLSKAAAAYEAMGVSNYRTAVNNRPLAISAAAETAAVTAIRITNSPKATTVNARATTKEAALNTATTTTTTALQIESYTAGTNTTSTTNPFNQPSQTPAATRMNFTTATPFIHPHASTLHTAAVNRPNQANHPSTILTTTTPPPHQATSTFTIATSPIHPNASSRPTAAVNRSVQSNPPSMKLKPPPPPPHPTKKPFKHALFSHHPPTSPSATTSTNTSTSKTTTPVPHDPLFAQDPLLNAQEMEVIYLGVESMYCLRVNDFDWGFVYEHASEALRVELRQDTALSHLVRLDTELIHKRFDIVKETLLNAMIAGYRRPAMASVVCEHWRRKSRLRQNFTKWFE